MIFRLAVLAAVVATLVFTPVERKKDVAAALTVPETVVVLPDSLESTSSFYSFRRDLRKCASPRCGGYFVKLVNNARTRCADNRWAAECYVASIDWNEQPEPENDRALLRGTMRLQGGPNGRFGVLRVTEVWQAAGSTEPSGTFFRVRDRGIRCIAAPCATHHEARLNSTQGRDIAGVDLGGAGAPEKWLNGATEAMTLPNGILVSGNHAPVTGPAGRSQMLKATQFYLRADKATASTLKPCIKTGCSGQVCSDQEVMTTCEYKTEYECYKKATCERQASGDCGFTPTPELNACLRRIR
ncbi:MAG TPA: DUF6748 domain-containing protein [Pyrinomonadaceae bacterium]|jgi:hypothetical protein|nr:DUF6748 domain-containing protein [Pyrinomonadaceae bacterium]